MLLNIPAAKFYVCTHYYVLQKIFRKRSQKDTYLKGFFHTFGPIALKKTDTSQLSHSTILDCPFHRTCASTEFYLKKINKLKEEYHSCLLQEVFMSALNLNKDDP